MQLKLNKEFRNNSLLHGWLVRLIIALEQSVYSTVISFEHLNGVGGLDKVVMPDAIIIRHAILL
jgi:hypothetical protein